MPELPEVETMARDLAPQLIGRTIRDPFLARPKLSPDPDLLTGIAGRRISAVRRRAKSIVIDGAAAIRCAEAARVQQIVAITDDGAVVSAPALPPLRSRTSFEPAPALGASPGGVR